MWWSCNPQNDHWVLKYAMWWLHPEGHPNAGRPDPERNGVIRYLLRINGDLVWGDTREELIEKYGDPDLPVDHKDQVDPISFQGLFGTIDDNPPLLRSNPSYKKNLDALPRLECERLRWGNWFARPENSSYYVRTDIEEVTDYPHPSELIRVVRAYDFAGTLPHDGNRHPDFFASVKMGKLKNGNYIILDAVRTRITFGSWLDHILENAARDGYETEIILPEDPNPQSKAATTLLVRSLNEHGYVTKMRRAPGGKLDSFRPFAASVEVGVVQMVKNCCNDLWNKITNNNDFFHNELESFDGTRSTASKKDDLVDCCSLAYLFLAQRVNIPNFLTGLQTSQLTFDNPFQRAGQ